MFRLVFHLSGDAERAVPLPDAAPLTIGRGEENAIRLDDLTVSRVHARLTPLPEGSGWIIEDLDSSNGLRLNGSRITRAELKPDDRLFFGELGAIFRPATPAERMQDAANAEQGDPVVGRIFAARYDLAVLLGETPAYDNYRAADLADADRPVSIRIFLPVFTAEAGGAEAMRARFETIRAAPSHPNLTALQDFGSWRDKPYLVTPWIDGHPLLDVLRRRGSLTVAEVLRFARQVAAATTHARAHRLPSPDLHPRAVLVAFDPPLIASGKPGKRDKTEPVDPWTKLLGKPVDRWPAFTLKITPQLGVPDADYPFGALLCELLGAPPTLLPGARSGRPRIPSLGERGNEVLARGLSSRGESFGGDVAFVETLARLTDPRYYD